MATKMGTLFLAVYSENFVSMDESGLPFENVAAFNPWKHTGDAGDHFEATQRASDNFKHSLNFKYNSLIRQFAQSKTNAGFQDASDYVQNRYLHTFYSTKC